MIVSSDGKAESVTVTVADRVPTALGVKVTVKVQRAFAARIEVQGVVPPGAAAKSPLPVMIELMAVVRLLVRVTFCEALLVATVCAANVRDAGENDSGRTAVPLASRIC